MRYRFRLDYGPLFARRPYGGSPVGLLAQVLSIIWTIVAFVLQLIVWAVLIVIGIVYTVIWLIVWPFHRLLAGRPSRVP